MTQWSKIQSTIIIVLHETQIGEEVVIGKSVGEYKCGVTDS